MGKNTKGYSNLDAIVRSVMVDLKDYTFHNYRPLLHIAAQGFTELNMFVINNVKTVRLPVNENFTVDLPDDYIDYTKIGIVINGKVWTLGYNKEIAMPREVDECGETIASLINCSADSPENSSQWGFYFSSHFRNGRYVGEIYGMGGGFNFAYYNIDPEKRQIVLTDGVPKGFIYLEYLSSGVSAEGSTTVPRQAVQAVKEYTHWKNVEYDFKNVPMNERKNREAQYYIQFEMLADFENTFTLEEYLDHTYQESKSGPHR